MCLRTFPLRIRSRSDSRCRRDLAGRSAPAGLFEALRRGSAASGKRPDRRACRRSCTGFGGRTGKFSQSERNGRQQGTRAVGIDDDFLAFVVQRHHLRAAGTEEPEGFTDVEQRGVLDAEVRGDATEFRQQLRYVRRTILQPHQLAPFGAASVGVGVDPVEVVPVEARNASAEELITRMFVAPSRRKFSPATAASVASRSRVMTSRKRFER